MSVIRPQNVTDLLNLAGYIEGLEIEVGSLDRRLKIESARVNKLMDLIYELSEKLVQHNYGGNYPNDVIAKLKEEYCKWINYDKP